MLYISNKGQYLFQKIIISLFTVSLFSLISLPIVSAPTKFTTASSSKFNPTETPEQIDLVDLVNSLLSPKEECILPCFMGLQVGETTLNETKGFFEETFNQPLESPAITGNILEYYPTLDFGLGIDEEISPFILGLFFRNQLLRIITLNLDDTKDWLTISGSIFLLQELLGQIDSTPLIYVAIKALWGNFFLILDYDELGLTIEYRFDFEQNQYSYEKPIQICPQPEQVSAIRMRIQSDMSYFRTELMPPPEDDFFYWSVEKMLGISAEEFINQIISNSDNCFSAPSYGDLQQMGYDNPF
ncbi:MAG: hypothetical protein HY862_01420 [Chloroflexi bacterium]|nr:hypothetical protein [Chloroflexota bacterium]